MTKFRTFRIKFRDHNPICMKDMETFLVLTNGISRFFSQVRHLIFNVEQIIFENKTYCFFFTLSILSSLNNLNNYSHEGNVFDLFKIIFIKFFSLIDKFFFKFGIATIYGSKVAIPGYYQLNLTSYIYFRIL